MRRAPCPVCGNVNVIADQEWGTEVDCEGLGPPHRFMAIDRATALAWTPPVAAPAVVPPTAPAPFRLPTRREAAPPPPPPQPPPAPLLTAPHRCQPCGGEIARAFGRRKDTVLHEREGLEPCRTDVTAALYYCPRCPPGRMTLLESPWHQWGQEGRCPRCAGAFTVPRDDLLHRRRSDSAEPSTFSFPCPACRAALSCDERHVGAAVACLHCSHVIEVPPAGAAGAGPRAPRVPDAREAVQDSADMPCPKCSQHVPRRAERCPSCGHALAEVVAP